MPCTYSTETYNEVLRWLDNTPVKYNANPKLKSSKSFVRYAKYSKAKTAGEALRLGSYYLDLLFDHEHGHLRAAGGPKRRELVSPRKEDWDDTWNKTDKILSTMHRKWITWTKTFQVADRLGVDRRNLTSGKMGGISVEMHAQRMEAQVMAKLILQEADRRSLPITDADLHHVLKLWAWKENTSRQNVMPEGAKFVHSDTLGLLSSYDGSVLVNNSTKYYPEVPKLMCRWLQDHLPKEMRDDKLGFAFTSINVNRGYAAKLHRDGNNEGPSFIAAFGDFTGGELNYWGDDDKTRGTTEKCCAPADALRTDIKKKLMLFDGNRGHSVEPFEGDRFTLVWFSIGRSHKASPEAQQSLRDCGFPFPDAEGLRRNQSQLSPPLGYGDASRRTAAKRHTYRAFHRAAEKRPVFSLLTEEEILAAKEAAKFVEPPPEEADHEPDTEFVDHVKDRKLTPEGLKTLRVFLKGASGRLVLALEGVEQKKGTARYDYRKAEGFTHGPPLESNQLCEVYEWIGKVVKKPAKTPKKRKAAAEVAKGAEEGAEEEVRTPAKKQKAPASTPTEKAALEPAGARRRPGRPSLKGASKSPPAPKLAKVAKVAKMAKMAKKLVASNVKATAKGALERLVQCTDDTAVQYKAGGKTAESHPGSYERYLAYSKAKTLGQALELGASAGDLLYDVRTGLLSIAGERRRGRAAHADTRFGRLALKWSRQLKA